MTTADQEDRTVSYQARGNIAVIALPARADAASVLTLRSRSERALATGSRAIAIDLRATDHIDTPTLSELGAALHRISRHNPKLAIVGADARVRWVLELCDIDGLELHATIRAALAHLRAGRLLRAAESVVRPRSRRMG